MGWNNIFSIMYAVTWQILEIKTAFKMFQIVYIVLQSIAHYLIYVRMCM